jgi:hypothetical protein
MPTALAHHVVICHQAIAGPSCHLCQHDANWVRSLVDLTNEIVSLEAAKGCLQL